jgi:alpha-ribazole phosphatase/probable phosphoglycerate mutase
MREFLEDVKQRYPGKHLLMIGHQATRWSLKVLVSGKTFEDIIRQPFEWQPYWEYRA